MASEGEKPALLTLLPRVRPLPPNYQTAESPCAACAYSRKLRQRECTVAAYVRMLCLHVTDCRAAPHAPLLAKTALAASLSALRTNRTVGLTGKPEKTLA